MQVGLISGVHTRYILSDTASRKKKKKKGGGKRLQGPVNETKLCNLL